MVGAEAAAVAAVAAVAAATEGLEETEAVKVAAAEEEQSGAVAGLGVVKVVTGAAG